MADIEEIPANRGDREPWRNEEPLYALAAAVIRTAATDRAKQSLMP